MSRIFWLLIVLLASGLGAWRLTRLDFPVTKTLEARDGRSIEAEVIGRTRQEVTVVRAEDEQRFAIPVEDLSRGDRLFLKRLPLRDPPPPPPPPEPDEVVKPKDFYIARREAEIAELRRKAEVLRIEVNSGTLNSMVQSTRSRQLVDIEKEIKTLETAIESYRWRKKIE